MTMSEIDERQMREVQAVVESVQRMFVDMTVEQKRLVIERLDVVVAAEEATWAAANKRQQH